jgi:iron complex outermembrane recepter protein
VRQTSANVLACVLLVVVQDAAAQRTQENAVSEAEDAFGTTVGREEIGLYSAGSARGFNPSEAGNLRIDGMYFDQVAKPINRVVRGSSVHVGISAQGLLFPAPTGVVDFSLRVPTNEAATGALFGYASYGNQAYTELDFGVPVISDTLSIGGGIGYTRNSAYNIADSSDNYEGGIVARWEPVEELVITPFWSHSRTLETGERQHVFIGNDGVPKFRGVDLMPQPWADYRVQAYNYGSTLRYKFSEGWNLEAGLFRSEQDYPLNYDPFLTNTNGIGEGNYSISAVPPRGGASTSGEVRLSRTIVSGQLRNTVSLNTRGRNRRDGSGGADRITIGPGSVRAIPLIEPPIFATGETTLIEAKQFTPGIAYDGLWRDVGQLNIGLQKSYYERTVINQELPINKESVSPWIYNVGASAFLSSELVVYASYTKGFEEIGNAPINAQNRGDAAPAQLTKQTDLGLRYQLTPTLQVVAGLFEIEKPYFDLDQANVYRKTGAISNSGVELSLAGKITSELTVIAGYVHISPKIDPELSGEGESSAIAVGPVPGQFHTNLQYRIAGIDGLILDAKVVRLSKRYARYDAVKLPSVTTFDVGVRYETRLFGRNSTLRLQGFNLSNEYALTPAPSGKITPFDARGFEFSVAVDL